MMYKSFGVKTEQTHKIRRKRRLTLLLSHYMNKFYGRFVHRADLSVLQCEKGQYANQMNK